VGLVYLRGQAPRITLDMTLPGPAGPPVAGQGIRPLFWNVEEDEASPALAEVEADPELWGLLFWIPLMRGAAGAANVTTWLRLMQQVASKRRRGDLGRIALVFADLAGTVPVWQDALKEVDMTESKVVNEWIAEAVLKAEVGATRRALLEVVEGRFPGALSGDYKTLLETQDSLPLLQEWLRAAATALTFHDFQRFCGVDAAAARSFNP